MLERQRQKHLLVTWGLAHGLLINVYPHFDRSSQGKTQTVRSSTDLPYVIFQLEDILKCLIYHRHVYYTSTEPRFPFN